MTIAWPRVATASGFNGGQDGSGGSSGGGCGPRWPGMKVFGFISPSEGAGKTVLAAHTAVQAGIAEAGQVAIVDTDSGGTTANWWTQRKAQYPAFVHTSALRVAETLARLRDLDVKTCIVDTSTALDWTMEHVIAAVDIVVIPCRPQLHDLRAAGAVVELAERIGKGLVFVINAATPGARLTAEAALALSQFGALAPVTIPQDTELADSMARGGTVVEISPQSDTALEIAKLWQYLDGRVGTAAY